MADPIKVYGLSPNKSKNSNAKLRLFSVQSLGVAWNGGQLFPGVSLASLNCGVELYACSDHRSSFVYKDLANGKPTDLGQAWWRLDPPSTPPGNPPAISLPQVNGGQLVVNDAGKAANTTQLLQLGFVSSGSGQIFVNGNNASDDPPWYVIPFVEWFSLRLVVQIQVNLGGQTLTLRLEAIATVKPGPKQTATIAGFDMPETWISSFSGQLGYVALEKTNSAAAADFWSDRAWALAIAEAQKSVFLGNTPWTFGLLKSAFVGAPNAVGQTPNPIGQIVYDQLRCRLTPASNFYANLVAGKSQIPPGNRTYAVGASIVNQQSANWCVAAATLFEVVRHNPVGFALRSAGLWEQAELIAEYATAFVNYGATVPPGGYTRLPVNAASTGITTPVAFLDWMWMMAVRIAGMSDLVDACNEAKGTPWYEIAATLEAGFSTIYCSYQTAWVTEESSTKVASAAFDKGKPVLMSANTNLFAPLSATGIATSATFPGHTLVFSGHLSIKEHSHFWLDNGSYRMALYTWGKYYAEVVFGEGDYEDYLRAFIYEP